MKRSESIANLAAALAKAQTKLRNPHFDSVNPHFNSKFASLAAVRESVIPVLAAHGISCSQWPVSDGGYSGCVTVLAHESGEWMEETFLIPVDKASAHGFSSCVTYAKRISMQSVAGVVGDEDDDGNAANGPTKVAQITGAQVTVDAYESLAPDEQTWIDDLASTVGAMVEAGQVADALADIDHAIPKIPRPNSKDSDYKMALWSRLGPKTRSALKRAGKEAA